MKLMELRIRADNLMDLLFPRDKAIHLIIGLHVFVASILLGVTDMYALTITIVTAVLIEVLQRVFNIGEASWADAFYVMYGGALPFAVLQGAI